MEQGGGNYCGEGLPAATGQADLFSGRDNPKSLPIKGWATAPEAGMPSANLVPNHAGVCPLKPAPGIGPGKRWAAGRGVVCSRCLGPLSNGAVSRRSPRAAPRGARDSAQALLCNGGQGSSTEGDVGKRLPLPHHRGQGDHSLGWTQLTPISRKKAELRLISQWKSGGLAVGVPSPDRAAIPYPNETGKVLPRLCPAGWP